MEENLKVAAIQFNITLGEIDQNLTKAEAALVRVAKQDVKLAVLPEMWSAGYDYRRLAKHAAETPRVVEAICRLSSEYKMVVIGSLPCAFWSSLPKEHNC